MAATRNASGGGGGGSGSCGAVVVIGSAEGGGGPAVCAAALRAAGMNVSEFESAKEAFRLLPATQADVLVLQTRLRDMSGAECLQVLRRDFAPTAPIIVLTLSDSPDSAASFLSAGASDWLTPNLGGELMVARVRMWIEHAAIKQKQLYQQNLETIGHELSAMEERNKELERRNSVLEKEIKVLRSRPESSPSTLKSQRRVSSDSVLGQPSSGSGSGRGGSSRRIRDAQETPVQLLAKTLEKLAQNESEDSELHDSIAKALFALTEGNADGRSPYQPSFVQLFNSLPIDQSTRTWFLNQYASEHERIHIEEAQRRDEDPTVVPLSRASSHHSRLHQIAENEEDYMDDSDTDALVDDDGASSASSSNASDRIGYPLSEEVTVAAAARAGLPEAESPKPRSSLGDLDAKENGGEAPSSRASSSKSRGSRKGKLHKPTPPRGRTVSLQSRRRMRLGSKPSAGQQYPTSVVNIVIDPDAPEHKVQLTFGTTAPRVWGVDVFSMESHELHDLVVRCFHDLGVLDAFDVPEAKVLRFAEMVERGYRENPFHNFRHAVDVMHTAFMFVTTTPVGLRLSQLDWFALLVAALCHDLDHAGVNNAFEINTRSHLALLYNDRSVLENHHCHQAFEILLSPDLALLETLSRDQFKQFREALVSGILNTDMAMHFELVNRFSAALRSGLLQDENSNTTRMMFDVTLHASDISSATKDWQLSKQWSDRVMEEFFYQGDLEKRKDMPVAAFMDRETASPPNVHLNFIEYIALPLYEVLAEAFPELSVCLDKVQHVRGQWAALQVKDLDPAVAQAQSSQVAQFKSSSPLKRRDTLSPTAAAGAANGPGPAPPNGKHRIAIVGSQGANKSNSRESLLISKPSVTKIPRSAVAATNGTGMASRSGSLGSLPSASALARYDAESRRSMSPRGRVPALSLQGVQPTSGASSDRSTGGLRKLKRSHRRSNESLASVLTEDLMVQGTNQSSRDSPTRTDGDPGAGAYASSSMFPPISGRSSVGSKV